MAKLALKKASTDVSVYLFAQDSSKTTGVGLAGLAYNTASLTAYYVRPLGSAAQITLATQTVTGAHSDGGFVEVDATNMPGVYRLDLPDAVCATGVPSAVVMLKGAANLAPVLLEIQLTDFDLNTAAITAAGIADAVWDEATADHTTATSFGSLDANIDAIKAKSDLIPAQPAAIGSAMTLTSAYDKAKDDVLTPLGVVDGIVDAIKAKTDTIPASPAQAGEYTAAIAAIPTTPLLAANYTAPDNASISAIKAKTDTIPASPAVAGEYTASIAAIQADLDNPNQYKADVSGIPAAVWGYATRTLSSFGTLISDIWSHATRTLSAFGFTVATQSDANVTAIKAKTDNLPAIPAPANEYDAELAAIQADLDNPNQYKADVSNLATTAHVQEVEDKVDAIKLKTDNIPANPATAGEYTASLAAIQADVSGIPDAILTKAIVDTLTVEQVLKVLAAVETGITTGGGTDTIVYTGKDGTVIRLTGVDEDGNRSAVIVIPGA